MWLPFKFHMCMCACVAHENVQLSRVHCFSFSTETQILNLTSTRNVTASPSLSLLLSPSFSPSHSLSLCVSWWCHPELISWDTFKHVKNRCELNAKRDAMCWLDVGIVGRMFLFLFWGMVNSVPLRFICNNKWVDVLAKWNPGQAS